MAESGDLPKATEQSNQDQEGQMHSHLAGLLTQVASRKMPASESQNHSCFPERQPPLPFKEPLVQEK